MSAPGGKEQPRKARLLQLICLIYGAACGGAFGAEEMVSLSGPGMALACLVVVPFVFSLPVAFAVSELTTAFPMEGGIYQWARMGLGEFWGFQGAWWAWCTGLITNVLFVQLFASYLTRWVPGLAGPQWWLACLVLIWSVYWVNLRGIDLVGNAAVALTVALLIPFVVMTWMGVAAWAHDPFTPAVAPGQSPTGAFGASLALCIFLYSGYEKLSTVAEEVEDPQRIFPPALAGALLLSILTYVLPTMAGLAALGNWQEWKPAYFSDAALRIGGPWLGHAMTLSGLLGNALLLNVTVLAVSRVPLVLAEDGYLPGLLSRHHPVYGTPHESLFWGSVTLSVLAVVPFDAVVVANAWLQMAALMLTFACVWALRAKRGDAPRPFSFPLGRPGLVLGTLVTSGLALFCLSASVFEAGRFAPLKLASGAAALASGGLAWLVATSIRGRAWAGVDPRRGARPQPVASAPGPPSQA